MFDVVCVIGCNLGGEEEQQEQQQTTATLSSAHDNQGSGGVGWREGLAEAWFFVVASNTLLAALSRSFKGQTFTAANPINQIQATKTTAMMLTLV